MRSVLQHRFHLLVFDRWDELVGAAEVDTPEAILVDLYHPTGPGAIDRMTRTVERLGCGLVVCSDFRGNQSDLVALGLAGVNAVLPLPGLGPRHRIQEALERAVGQAIAKDVVGSVEDRLPDLARRTLDWAVRHATTGSDAERMARGVGCASAKVLAERLRQRSLPTARRTLLWGRLMVAVRLLERGENSVESISERVGYASRSGLTRAATDVMGAPPTRIAQQGGIEALMESFVEEVRSLRGVSA